MSHDRGAQRPHGGGNAAIVSEVVLNSGFLLRLRAPGFPARIAHRQIEPLLIFPVPALQGILGWASNLLLSESALLNNMIPFSISEKSCRIFYF
jgi:hypothetical protein